MDYDANIEKMLEAQASSLRHVEISLPSQISQEQAHNPKQVCFTVESRDMERLFQTYEALLLRP